MLQFLASNWVLLAFIGFFVLMHRGGGCGSHGSHGSHGNHRRGDASAGQGSDPATSQPHHH